MIESKRARGPMGVAFRVLIAGLLVTASSPAQGPDAVPSLRHWGVTAGGSVRATAGDGDDLFLAGDFGGIEPSCRTHALLDTSTAALHPTSPGIVADGYVNVVRPDGAGGWYLGGRFNALGTTAVQTLVHVLPSGEVDPAFTAVMPTVFAFGGSYPPTVEDLVVDSGRLYVAGSFASVNGVPRVDLAALDAATGAVLPFDAGFTVAPLLGVSGVTVRQIEVSGSQLYLLGDFTSVQGQVRNGLAAVDKLTGAVRPWDPSPAPVGAASIVAQGGVVWIAGAFATIRGVSAPSLVAVDGVTAAPLSGFAAGIGGTVSRLHLEGSSLFLWGFFTSVNGTPRNGLAELDAASGALLPWNPPVLTLPLQSTYFVNVVAFAATSTRVWIGGRFDFVGGSPVKSLAALDRATGQLIPWDAGLVGGATPNFTQVAGLALDGARLHAVGNFAVAGRSRNRAACIGLRDGLPRPFAPTVNGPVEAIAVRGDAVFLGGVFSNVGGQPRLGLARVDRTTGAVASWNAAANSAVTRLIEVDGTLYCAGNFTSLGGQSRNRLGAVSVATGLATAFDPAPDGPVRALEARDGVLWVGGAFTTIAGQPRDRLAAFDLASGQLLPWNPGADGPVTALRAAPGEVFVGGDFGAVAGQPRARLASLDAVTGALTPWAPTAAAGGTAPIASLEVEGPLVWVAGPSAGAPSAIGLVQLDRVTGQDLGWPPQGSGVVEQVRRYGRRLVVAGTFDQGAPWPRPRGVAVFGLRDLATVGTVTPGCSNAAPGPRLRAGRPVLGVGHAYLVDRAPPFAPGALYVSFEPPVGEAPLLLPGSCVSGLQAGSLALLATFTTDATGAWTLPIAIPALPALQNLPIRASAALSVPGGPLLGAFDLTETLELTIGS